MRVTVTVDKEKGEIRIADTGIGMTDEEVRRYINQVAFSSAEEFLKNYQGEKGEEKADIIGHFGLVRSSFSLAFFWIALISSIA